jgi:uncharacterized protein (UPF0218 family)
VLETEIHREKPTKVCVVGDFTTLKTLEYGIEADLYIIDNKIMRKPIDVLLPQELKLVKTINPAGMITVTAWETVKKTLCSDIRTGIVVEGEEDLLALPVIKFAPLGAFVVYGQPNKGIVVVRVTKEKKKEINEIISLMHKRNSNID